MLKRLYTRLLLWALGPAIREMKVSANQIEIGPVVLGHQGPKASWERMMDEAAETALKASRL